MLPIFSSAAFHRRSEDAEARWFIDILWILLATGEDTGGQYSVIEQYMPEGAGPGPHVHPFADEAFYVIAGEITAVVGDKTVVLGPNSFGHIPRNTPHAFKVTGKEVCHCLNYYTPAGFEQAILGCSRPAEARTLPPPGLDAPDSPAVLNFASNYWVAPAELPWARQNYSRE